MTQTLSEQATELSSLIVKRDRIEGTFIGWGGWVEETQLCPARGKDRKAVSASFKDIPDALAESLIAAQR